MELFRHKVKIKNILFRNASEVMSALIAAWKVLGIPEYSHSAALTRRATKYSRIHAVVVQWSRTRKRYERQGILAEPKAIQRAMQDCLTDAEIRKIHRQREQQKREEMDLKYIEEFASKIRKLFPRCPAQEEVEIASGLRPSQ